MTALDDIRAEIVNREQAMHDRRILAEAALAEALRNIRVAETELMAHDRAVSLFGAREEAPKRAPRRDLAALVLAALTDEWQTVSQLTAAIPFTTPSRVQKVLKRLNPAKATVGSSDGLMLRARRTTP
jgi:hypothetical protein